MDARPVPERTKEVRSRPRTARERARAEITGEILEVARRQLASDGAAGLRLRAIARDLGMVSSALYRYFPSRDALLTRLIVDAYDSLGTAVEQDEAAVDRPDVAGRFAAVCRAVRAWALDHPNEYGLIYGSPVPGYAAPADTIGPASRVSLVLVGILTDAATAGRLWPPPDGASVSPEGHQALEPLRRVFAPEVPDRLVLHGLMVWTGLFGTVSFELFGQLHNVVGEAPGQRQAFFDDCVGSWAAQLGLL
jgi:AcrR family transcriptional regulator